MQSWDHELRKSFASDCPHIVRVLQQSLLPVAVAVYRILVQATGHQPTGRCQPNRGIAQSRRRPSSVEACAAARWVCNGPCHRVSNTGLGGLLRLLCSVQCCGNWRGGRRLDCVDVDPNLSSLQFILLLWQHYIHGQWLAVLIHS